MSSQPIRIATRGSALALAQAHIVLEHCRKQFPDHLFEIKTIKTTGDKLQTASLADANLPKGLFTKELEVALIDGEAELAVHSLKDLPTELPAGLKIGAVLEREDVRDVLICRYDAPFADAAMSVHHLPHAGVVATSSTRRAAQLREIRPDLNIISIRGNVPTRLRKLAQQQEIDAIVLAAAGLARLQIQPLQDGLLTGPEEVMTPGLCAAFIPLQEMLPCVGQGAIGIEVCQNGTPTLSEICQNVCHFGTLQCVLAERAFLRAMGGGCQLAVAAHARWGDGKLHMRTVSFLHGTARRADGEGADPVELGQRLAAQIT
jgi:hydroxymethylbilane synthase